MMMRKIFLLFLLTMTLSAQDLLAQTAEEIVQQQLDTYNARDLEGFMALFSDDSAVVNHADGKVLARGKAAVEKLYQGLFDQSPNLHSNLTNRIVLGNTVIDHETITGRMGQPDAIELVVIYEVENQKIKKATVIKK